MARQKSPSLRKLREDRGLTLAHGAEALGISEAWLSRVERGQFEDMPVYLAVRIRDLYGIPVDHWAANRGAA